LKTVPNAYTNTFPMDVFFLVWFSNELIVKLSCNPLKFWNSYWNILALFVWFAELTALCMNSGRCHKLSNDC
jgi:hypothetical protein